MDIIKAQDIVARGFTIKTTMIVLEVVQLAHFATLACVDAEVVMKKDMDDVGIELPILTAGKF